MAQMRVYRCTAGPPFQLGRPGHVLCAAEVLKALRMPEITWRALDLRWILDLYALRFHLGSFKQGAKRTTHDIQHRSQQIQALQVSSAWMQRLLCVGLWLGVVGKSWRHAWGPGALAKWMSEHLIGVSPCNSMQFHRVLS